MQKTNAMSKLRPKVNLILCEIRQAKIEKDTKSENLWLNRLLKCTYRHLRIIAKMKLVCKELDRECVLNALEKVMNYLKTFDPKRDGYNWICRAVVRCAYDINNGLAPPKMYFDAPSYLDEFDPDKHLNKSLFQESLDEAYRALPEEERAIVTYYSNGDSLREIAAKTGIAKSTVKYRFKKICEKMKIFF